MKRLSLERASRGSSWSGPVPGGARGLHDVLCSIIRKGSGALALAAALGSASPARAERPRVDTEAMREAMLGAGGDEHYASSRAYFYYLRAMIEAANNDHRSAIDDLRQAEIYDPDAPAIRVALAEQLERMGDLGRAEEELRRASARHPKDEPTLYALGRVLSEEKKQAKAIKPLLRALKLKPDDSGAAIALAQVYLDVNQEERAAKVIDALGRAAPDDGSGYRFFGQSLAERGQTKRAERYLRLAMARAPGDVETLQVLAKLLEDANRLNEAAQAYDQALASDPEEPNVLLAAGSLALRRNDLTSAHAYFESLLGVMPDDVDVKVKIAFAWFGARRLHEAAQLLDDARKTLPEDPRLAFYAGLVHEDERAFPAAASAFAAVDKNAELYTEAQLHLGGCLSMAGQHAEAIATLKRGLEQHATSRAYLVALADAYARAGRLGDGVSLLEQAAVTQGSDELIVAHAELLTRNNKVGDAVAVLERAIAQRPNHPRLLFALAEAYSKAKNYDRATASMKVLLSIEPDNANALNFMAYTLAEQGAHLDDAERFAKRALQLRPDSGAFTDSLGWVMYQRGEYRQAIDLLQRAEALAPNEPVIIEHLGDALIHGMRRTDGADAYRRALRLLDLEPDPAEREQLERKLRSISVQQAGK